MSGKWESALSGVERGGSVKRWLALFGVVLGATLILEYFHLSETAIDMELHTSSVGFTIDGPFSPQHRLSATRMVVTGLSEVYIPGKPPVKKGESDLVVELSTSFKPGSAGGVLGFPAINCGPDTVLEISHEEAKRNFKLKFIPPQLDSGGIPEFVIGLPKSAELVVRNTSEKMTQETFMERESIRLVPGNGPVSISLVLPDDDRAVLFRTLGVRDLELFGLDQGGIGEQLSERRVSTIISGTYTFPEIEGTERKLRAGQWITSRSAYGELASFIFGQEDVSFVFLGRVEGMRLGVAAPQSLMPTWLDWVRSKRWLVAAVGFITILASLSRAIRPDGGVRRKPQRMRDRKDERGKEEAVRG